MHTPTQLHRYSVPVQRFAVVKAFPAPDQIERIEVQAACAMDAMLEALHIEGVFNAFTPTQILDLPLRRQQLLDAGIEQGLAHRLAAAECNEALGTDARRAA